MASVVHDMGAAVGAEIFILDFTAINLINVWPTVEDAENLLKSKLK